MKGEVTRRFGPSPATIAAFVLLLLIGAGVPVVLWISVAQNLNALSLNADFAVALALVGALIGGLAVRGAAFALRHMTLTSTESGLCYRQGLKRRCLAWRKVLFVSLDKSEKQQGLQLRVCDGKHTLVLTLSLLMWPEQLLQEVAFRVHASGVPANFPYRAGSVPARPDPAYSAAWREMKVRQSLKYAAMFNIWALPAQVDWLHRQTSSVPLLVLTVLRDYHHLPLLVCYAATVALFSWWVGKACCPRCQRPFGVLKSPGGTCARCDLRYGAPADPDAQPITA